MFNKLVAIISFASILFLAKANGPDNSLQSTPEQVHMLELYTSQGCSSCPPADKWLSSLTNNQGLWKNFVPVAFHVDYWDYLGWKDPYSQAKYTARQREIAKSWGTGTVYTPGAVLDGAKWDNWGSDAALKAKTKNVGILKATQQGDSGNFAVEFSPDKTLTAKDWVLHGALLGNGIQTKILNGENKGKDLTHDFVALDLGEIAMIKSGTKYQGKLELASTLESNAKSLAVVFWVAEKNSTKAVQTVGGTIMKDKMAISKAHLTKLQYDVTQNEGTEAPFHNEYWDNHKEGIYVDIVSGEPLFSSLDKYDSGTGWPSFTKPIDSANIIQNTDYKIGMARTELKSKNGKSHLGHVFDDGPGKDGKRFCINSAALKFIPVADLEKAGYAQYLKMFKGTLAKK